MTLDNRFYMAMGCYAVLALLAAFTLSGPFRIAVWVFLGGLAVKTWLVTLRRDEDDS
jgi:predicted membrane channel-forming protein YqfA (hemolysin III family)